MIIFRFNEQWQERCKEAWRNVCFIGIFIEILSKANSLGEDKWNWVLVRWIGIFLFFSFWLKELFWLLFENIQFANHLFCFSLAVVDNISLWNSSCAIRRSTLRMHFVRCKPHLELAWWWTRVRRLNDISNIWRKDGIEWVFSNIYD